MKLYGPGDGELMRVTALERDGNRLLVRGTVLGMMPITAHLDADQARAALRLLRGRGLLFLLSLPFRRRRRVRSGA